MIKRPRQIDYFRTLTRINEWEEFNSFDNEGQQANNASQFSQSGNNNQSVTLNGEKDKDGFQKKQEIPIIAASNVKTQNNLNQNIGTDELYKKRRIHQNQIWPLSEKYELADDDIVFLKDFNQTNNFNMKDEELEEIIESFEFKSGKDFIITWIDMKDHITNDLRDKYTFTNLEKIYNYWRIKRDLLKRPLLRLHWKPNFNDKDPHVAFRPRVAEKMKLRRSMKQNDDEQIQKLSQLKEEMAKYKLLVQQIKLREQMKEWILESQNISFVSELYKVDKSMQYFFVDDVFENHKDLEQKKQQMDEKIGSIREQNNQLNKSLSAYNLFPVIKHPKDISHQKLLRATQNPSSFIKDLKINPELIKAQDGANTNNSANPLSSTTISLVNGGLSKKESKKNQLQMSIPMTEELSSQIETETKKKPKDKIKGKKDENFSLEIDQSSGQLINLSLNKDKIIKKANSGIAVQPSTKENSLTQINNLKNLESLKKEDSSTKQTKSLKKDKEEGNQKIIAENQQSQAINNEKDGLTVTQDKFNQISTGESKELPVSSLSGLSLFNTDNFEFASFIASVFIEASKRELTLERVCNPDTKSIDREHLQHIIGSKSELAQHLKKINKSVNQPAGSQINKNPNLNKDPHNNYPMNMNYLPQNGNQSMNSHYQDKNVQQNQRQHQQQIRGFEQDSQYGAGVINQNQNEIPHTKKKNVIPFKPRLRTGRSGFIIIDRLFDDKDNLRYEDICSKEANYHPNKIVDKILAQQRLKESAEQQKLKVFSFKTSDRELYNKDYFQQRNMKYKNLAEDNEETQFLIPPNNTNNTSNSQSSSMTNPLPNQSGSNQGYTSAQLNGVSSAGGTQEVQLEDSINGLVLSSSVNSQQICNNEQDFKQLKKTINTALKNYQKTKQQTFFK